AKPPVALPGSLICATISAPDERNHPRRGRDSMRALNKITRWAGLVVVLVLAGIQSSTADPAGELAAIHAVDDAWVKACNAGDVGTMVAQYDEAAVLLPPAAPAASGKGAIRAFFVNMVAATAKDGLAFSLDTKPAGGARGDIGWASGNYVVKDKTGHVVDTGKYLSVSKKKDGKWLY